MKRILAILLVGVMVLSTMLVSCDKGNEDDVFQTTGAKKTQKTEATTKKPEQVEMPTNLVPEIEEKNAILSRITKKPVTTEIGDTGVTIDLCYYAWPTICKGEGTTLYAAASLRQRHIDPFAATAFFVSHDNGETWSEPKIINNTPVDDRDTGIVYIGGGKMLVSFFTIGASSFLPGGTYETSWGLANDEQKAAKKKEWGTYSNAELEQFSGSFVLVSDDYGETWSDPIKVPISCPHGPSLAQDGRTLLYAGLDGKNFVTYVSRDFGKTWSHSSSVLLPTLPDSHWGYWEPYVIQLKNGNYIGGIRTGTTSGDYNGNATLGILVTTSTDGKKWTTPKKISNVTGAPPHFLELDNGAILLTYSYRLREAEGGNGPIGCRGRISYDGGLTWSDNEIRLSENVSFTNYDLGYPSTVQLSDGTLITIYYQPWEDDTDCSVLYTKWRLVEAE